MGSAISKVEDFAHDTYRKTWPQVWYLAPSFIVSVGAVGYVGFALGQTKAIPSSSNISLLHLIGVGGGFGISLWITAVHGRCVQKMLNRHEFSVLQSHLSSVYFSASSIFAGLSLGTFLLRHPVRTWSKDATKLGIALFAGLVAAEFNSLFLNPMVTNLMFERNNFEFVKGSKTPEDIERLLNEDKKYLRVHNKFNLFHTMSIATGLFYHCIQWYHLFFMADKCLIL